ncbi:MAG: hypothetical protein SGI99_00930 [Pseudomonadota bacterium]|nr:hypothetical protein [Pseudomonadota bacterium]
MQTARRWGCGALIMLAGTVSAGNSVWTSTGPLGGGVFELIFSPLDPQTAYATTRGSVYKTVDSGASWARSSNGLVATSVYPLPLALDLEAPDTLYTFDSSLRLYRSDNGGDSWQILDDNLDADFLFSKISDVAGEAGSLFIGGVSQSITGLPQLFKSSDGGEVFVRIGTGLPADANIASITVDPLNANVVYVGIYGSGAVNQASLFRSNDGGANFVPSLNLFGTLGYQPDVQDLSFIAGTGATGSLFAVIDSNIYHSANGGTNWTGPHGPADRITAHPTDPLKSYFARSDGAFVWFAPNPTPTFLPYNDGLTPNISYTSIPGNVPIRAAVWRLVPQPGYPAPGTSLFATTEGSGVFEREESAPSWIAVATNPAGVGVRALAIHPHPSLNAVGGSNVLLAGHSGYAVTSPGLYRSTDQALSWALFNTGVRATELQTLRIDPTTLGGSIANTVMYAGGASAGVDPAYLGAGLLRSVNNGVNWLTMDGNLPQDVTGHANIGLVRDLVLDPRSCPTPPPSGPCTTGGLQKIYALAEGHLVETVVGPVTTYEFTNRIVRSTDQGSTWFALDGAGSGLPASFSNDDVSQRITPNALLVDPNNSAVLYLGTDAIYDDFDTGDPVNPADLPSGIFKSTNAGVLWTHLNSNGLPTKSSFNNTQLDVAALLIDPTNSNILWAALTDLRNTGYSTIYRSNDAGANWVRKDEGINGSVEMRALVFDPQDHNILYAAAGGYEANPGAVYRGVWNAGTQSIVWLSISIGLPAESAHTIAVDPFNPDVLHAGTDAGVVSITRSPDQDNDGIPDAAENQAPDVPGGIVGPGDGNGDGQMDATQRDVGSIGVSIRQPSGTGLGAVTTDLINGVGSAACSNGTAQAVDVQLIAPTALGLDAVDGTQYFYTHPLGTNSFEVLGCSSASIRIRYHGAAFVSPLWTFRIFAPLIAGDPNNIAWYDFSSNATRVGLDTWQINLTAGAFGSYRPELDAIHFVGGPACFNPVLFGDGFESNPTVIPPCPN